MSARNRLRYHQHALKTKLKFYDATLLVDTAGRLHVDEAMMDEIKQVRFYQASKRCFVVDAMTGRDSGEYRKTLARRCR